MKNRIRKIRKELGMTQKDFAAKIGTSQNILANYEAGRRTPSSSVINNICKTFHINESWLRAGEGEIFFAIAEEQEVTAWVTAIFAEETTTFKKRFLHMLMGLDETKWNLLEEIVQKTIWPFPDQQVPQEEMTASQAEAAYIKSRSKNVPKTAPPALSITADAANAERKKMID